MSSNIINRSPYLRTSREFPEEIHQLCVEVNKSYVDIANVVNDRTIGIFPINRPAISGEKWFFTSRAQQGLRQVYEFSAIAAGATLNIPYRINGYSRLLRLFGSVKTNLPDERPIPYSSVAANGNIDVRLDYANNQIVIAVGAGSPNVVSGFIVFEWLSEGENQN